jgi:two-component system response regulator HydG
MPGFDGLSLLARARQLDPERPVIIMTAFGAIDSAIESIRLGAYHYLAKPFRMDELIIFLGRAMEERAVRREAANLRRLTLGSASVAGLIGRSHEMRAALEVVERVSDTVAPVLLTGETGTGKSRVAATLHARSRRATGPFVAVNCAALPEALLESELFGHVKGAFTGAVADRAGLFVDAQGGTLFLDEIGEMSPALQAKLLRALETRRVRPVGSNREVDVDVRIVAATHRDLADAVQKGTFREDVLYRLAVVTIHLPPLRQRREDIPELAAYFFEEARRRYPESAVRRIGSELMKHLLEHRWPGNVRELAHTLERVVLLGQSEEACVADIAVTAAGDRASRLEFGAQVLPMRAMQRAYAAWAHDQLGGVRARTAQRLDIDVKTLARLLAPEDDHDVV